MITLLKRIISQAITAPIVGKIISLFFKRVSYFGIKVSIENSIMSSSAKAAVFWNIYESAEARLISKYIQSGVPVIEFGSSLGVISRLIGFKNKERVICVEANLKLIESIKFNLSDIQGLNFKIINCALSYSDNPVFFSSKEGQNLTGRVSKESGDIVQSITLSEVIATEGINEYTLVMDIEGSEIEILLNDRDSLKNCKVMIMELHETDYEDKMYSIDAMKCIIESIGFSLLERDGNCFAFNRKEG